jgi:hypothetical protein
MQPRRRVDRGEKRPFPEPGGNVGVRDGHQGNEAVGGVGDVPQTRAGSAEVEVNRADEAPFAKDAVVRRKVVVTDDLVRGRWSKTPTRVGDVEAEGCFASLPNVLKQTMNGRRPRPGSAAYRVTHTNDRADVPAMKDFVF